MRSPHTLILLDELELLDDVVEDCWFVIVIAPDSSSSTIVSYINIKWSVRTNIDPKNELDYAQCQMRRPDVQHRVLRPNEWFSENV